MRGFDYSKLSKMKWDNEILLLCSKIHECKGRQDLFVHQKPAQLDRLIEVAKIQSTESSNRIEGIVTTSTRIKKLVEEKTAPKNRDEKEILGYRNVLNTIHDSHEYISVSKNHILQLHRDLFQPAGISHGGSFKNVQNYIKETKPDGTEVVRFTPLAPYETPEAIEMICNSFRDTLAMETVDSLILIPAFICDFLCIHPFNDGNGRTARLMSGYILDFYGYGFNGIGSLEEYFAYDPDEYYESLQMGLPALYYSGRENPPHPEIWVNYFLRMVELYSQRVYELSKGVQEDDLDGSLSYLNAKEKDLLVFLLKKKMLEFTPIDVSKMLGVTNKTIINRCVKLTNNGFLVPNIVSQRIRSYSLSEFAKRNDKKILSKIG